MKKAKRRDNVAGIAVKRSDFPRHQADEAFFGQLSGGSRLTTGVFVASVKVKMDIHEYQQGVKEE